MECGGIFVRRTFALWQGMHTVLIWWRLAPTRTMSSCLRAAPSQRAWPQGMRVAIVDLTRGELGTRGTAETRATESAAAQAILGVEHRENLDLGDGFFEVNEVSLRAVIEVLRRLRPLKVLANAWSDRHPDHGRGAELVHRAAFLSGLRGWWM